MSTPAETPGNPTPSDQLTPLEPEENLLMPEHLLAESGGSPPVSIVLAEDEAIIRLDLRETLEDEGYSVVGETSRGDQVMDLVKELHPDVAILDVKMPGADGITVARQIRDQRLCAVLLLTAFSQRELIARAADAGALAYLVKPFERAELVPAVEVALARFRELSALSEQVARTEAKLESRKIIDRAKGYLMDAFSMSESEAYGHIQRRAMNERRGMDDVAEEILRAPRPKQPPSRAQ